MENQDIETKEEELLLSAEEEEENLSDSDQSLEAENIPEETEEMSPDSPEEHSAPPPSPIDGDIKSLPLSEEIQKQKDSQVQNKKRIIVSVVGVILVLGLIKVFMIVSGTSTPAGNGFFSIAKELGLIKDKAEIAGRNQFNKSGSSISAAGEPRNHFLDGIDYHKEGKINEAIKAFQVGMEKNPELKEIGYNNQGVIFAQNGKYKKGIRYFKQALKINPRYADAHYNLAAAYEKSRNEQRALFHYQRFIELAEEDYSGLTMRVKQHVGKR
jgi:tetratricopeptide (TPR) repeat protein